jgi:protein prenyltransferase alpha subunit repeat containing protein 1
MKFLLSSEETECAAGTSLVDLFLVQEIYLLSDCLNAPADEFGEACVQSELAALYILWISKQVPAVKLKLEERLHSLGSLEDVLARACPERSRLWTHLIA